MQSSFEKERERERLSLRGDKEYINVSISLLTPV